MIITTKAQTLAQLANKIESASIPAFYYFTVREWNNNKLDVLQHIKQTFTDNIIIRSSSLNEDCSESSNAGHFESILNIDPTNNVALEKAIIKVIDSYSKDDSRNLEDEVLVQKMATQICMSGVAFSCDPDDLTPYFIINYSRSSDTTQITSGLSDNDETFVYYRYSPYEIDDQNLNQVVRLVNELITIMQDDYIDVEFAIDEDNTIYLLQARKIVTKNKKDLSFLNLSPVLIKLSKKIQKLQTKHYDLLGETTAFGVMPDWNPAEIIGIKPNPLALSLYQELVTDYVWANHRKSYGCRDLTSNPLMTSFLGIPFIDIRVDFNSWIPLSLNEKTSEKLANYYIQQFINNKHLHDKIEFNIIFSCYTLSTDEKIKVLLKNDFTEIEINEIKGNLLKITNQAVNKIHENLELLEKLVDKHAAVISSDSMYYIDKIYWLVEDCKRYGIYPFAGLARCAFIAIDMLNSFIENNIITSQEKELFIQSLGTISSSLRDDYAQLNKNEFLDKYGCLRPSTYDITSLNYREGYDLYFGQHSPLVRTRHTHVPFDFSKEQKQAIQHRLRSIGFKFDVEILLTFIRSAIIQREYSKFLFAKSINSILELMKEIGAKNGIDKHDMAYTNIKTVLDMYHNINHSSVREKFLHDIHYNKELHQYSLGLKLPHNITSHKDIYNFYMENNAVNFITNNSISSEIVRGDELYDKDLKNKILCIENADPGYDFLFTKEIGGLITKFGGVNSHMAIRCSELNIPAVIGVGEKKFDKFSKARLLEINCQKQLINIID